MDLSAVEDFDGYIDERRAIECSYFDQYSSWKDRLYEWKEPAYEECFDDLFLPSPKVEPTPYLAELVEIVGAFANKCLKAYVRRIGTGGAFEILDRIEEHSSALLREVRTRKWTPAVQHLRDLATGQDLEDGWRQVEGALYESTWERLQPKMWQENKRWAGGKLVMKEILADEDEAARRRRIVDSFIQRCRSAFPDRKFTEAQISVAVGLSDNTLFKAWKSNNSAKSTVSTSQRFEEMMNGSPADFVALIERPPKARRKK